MNKKLSEMSKEELWQLFPIFLCKHDDCWADIYASEEKLLAEALPGNVIISHIGSTAVGTIMAKPIIDILVEVPANELSEADAKIISCGYRRMNTESGRIDYNKGYTENGFAERVFHLHLRINGDRDEIFFRDYLISHPETAKEYEALKLSLWKKYEHDRDGYTNAKGEFIGYYTDKAKKQKAGEL